MLANRSIFLLLPFLATLVTAQAAAGSTGPITPTNVASNYGPGNGYVVSADTTLPSDNLTFTVYLMRGASNDGTNEVVDVIATNLPDTAYTTYFFQPSLPSGSYYYRWIGSAHGSNIGQADSTTFQLGNYTFQCIAPPTWVDKNLTSPNYDALALTSPYVGTVSPMDLPTQGINQILAGTWIDASFRTTGRAVNMIAEAVGPGNVTLGTIKLDDGYAPNVAVEIPFNSVYGAYRFRVNYTDAWTGTNHSAWGETYYLTKGGSEPNICIGATNGASSQARSSSQSSSGFVPLPSTAAALLSVLLAASYLRN